MRAGNREVDDDDSIGLVIRSCCGMDFFISFGIILGISINDVCVIVLAARSLFDSVNN
jgi:hypothetical protein